jgi:hypothetical protein
MAGLRSASQLTFVEIHEEMSNPVSSLIREYASEPQ